MKKLLIILATILSLITVKAEASYTPPNSVTFPISIANGGTGSTTAQGALNNLNQAPINTASYVVALCTGFNDQNALNTAYVAAGNLLTSVLIPGGTEFGGIHGCQLNNTFIMNSNTIAYVNFFGWPQRAAYGSSINFGSFKPSIYMNNGFSPGSVNVDAFTTRGCFFDLNNHTSMAFRDLNLVASDEGATGTVALCVSHTGGTVGAGEGAFDLDHVSVTRSPNVVGCEISVPVRSTGTYTFTTNPINNDTIVLNGTTWTFVTSGATGNQTNIQGSATATVTQLVVDLTASADANISKATYANSGTLVLTISYKAGGRIASGSPFGPFGTAGNFYTLAAGTYGGTVSGATLTGGVDGGMCVGSLGNNVFQLRITGNSVFNEDGWITNGNAFDMFVDQSEIGGVYGAFSAPTGVGNTFGSGEWKVTNNRFEFMGMPPFGTMNGLGLVNSVISGNDFDNIGQPILAFTQGYSHVVFTANSVHGYGGPPVVIGTTTINGDAFATFNSSTAGAGLVTITGNAIDKSNHTFANYLARFDGTTDNNIIFMGNTGGNTAYNIQPYLFNTETPPIFASENIGDPFLFMGTRFGIGTTAPNAGDILDLSNNSSLAFGLPIGTTGTRPSGAEGMVRDNTSLPGLEAYYNSNWQRLQGNQVNAFASIGSQVPLTLQAFGDVNIATSNTAYFKFDDASGSTAVEAISAANGTWNGTLGSQWGTGIVNGDGVYNGTDNYISTTYAGVTGTAARTFSMWLKTSTPASCPAANKDVLAYGAGTFNITLCINGRVTKGLGIFYNSDYIIYTANSLFDGNFHHIAVTVPASGTGLTTKIYLDGVLLSSIADQFNASNAINTSAGNVTFGADISHTSFYAGQIDEAGFWSRQLSAAEVNVLYNNGLANQYPYLSQTANIMNITDSAANTLGVMNASGSLGIGTSNPLSKLTVTGLGTTAPLGTSGAGYMCMDVGGNTYGPKSTCP